MTRLACLLFPVALLAATGCCSQRYCGDPDPTPTHTFGPGGVVARNGGIFTKHEYCPMCEWSGTKCAACRAREAAEFVKGRPADGNEMVFVKDPPSATRRFAGTKDESDRMTWSLETRRVDPSRMARTGKAKETEEPDESGPSSSPYAAIRNTSVVRTTR